MLYNILQDYVYIADKDIKEDWRKINRNELCYKCCEYEGKDKVMYDAYVAAIIVRYWHLIKSNVARGKGAYGEEECYNWLIDSIMGTLQTKSWLNKESSLYKDPIAPDKSINVRMQSHRQGFYQWSNCQKRAGDFTINNSYEGLYEVAGDSAFPMNDKFYKSIDLQLSLKDLIKDEFNKKNYLGSFTIYGIINANVIDILKEGEKRYTKFNRKRLSTYVRHLDDDFCEEFSSTINLPEEDVKQAVECCKDLSRVRVYNIIDNMISSLPKKLSL